MVASVHGTGHYIVWDRALHVKLDATLGQVSGRPGIGAWRGRAHSHINDDPDSEWVRTHNEYDVSVNDEEMTSCSVFPGNHPKP